MEHCHVLGGATIFSGMLRVSAAIPTPNPVIAVNEACPSPARMVRRKNTPPSPRNPCWAVAAPTAVDHDGKVRVNAATATELEALPGVGPVLAQRIVDHRDVYGPYAAVEDLLEVPGIGEAKLASLRDSVAVP